jgi:hypothetical protein
MDTLDDRREIWKALHCVTPEQRVRILAYLSASVGGFFGRGVTVKDETWEKATWADRVYGASVNLTNEVYRDIWLLVSNYSLDPLVMGNTVIEFARKPHTIPPKKHFLSNGETVSKR